jgi:hypothetical protein
VNSLIAHASPLLTAFLALLYWWVFVEAEIKRHYVPTGKRWPRLRERKEIVLIKPAATHWYGATAVLFTLTFADMYYRPHNGWNVLIVTALIVYTFVALWIGPMLQVIPTLEGVGLMAAAINFALFLTVRTWNPVWQTLSEFTFGVVISAIAASLLIKHFSRSEKQRQQ